MSEDSARVSELMRLVENLKQENTRMRNVIAQRNAELNTLKMSIASDRARKAASEKQRIDEAMHRFAVRENSFK